MNISHNQLLITIKEVISDSFKNSASVLLEQREGIDYSVNTATQKPFNNIQQLYLQQLRKNENLHSPYFMPLHDIYINGFNVKNNQLAIILGSIDQYHSAIIFENYFNADYLHSGPINHDIAKKLFSNKLGLPYNAQFDKNGIPPDIPTYQPKSFLFNEQLAKKISEYFASCYTGMTYFPPKYTQNELDTISKYINKKESLFFKDVQNGHRTVKRGFEISKNYRKIDNVRKR